VRDHHRAAHDEAEDVGGGGRLGPSHLLAEDRLLDEGGAAAAELLRPREAGVAGFVQLALPFAPELEGLVVPLGLASGMVPAKPGAQLVAEGLLAGGQGQVHGARILLAAQPTETKR
jgi:hypothetical protein